MAATTPLVDAVEAALSELQATGTTLTPEKVQAYVMICRHAATDEDEIGPQQFVNGIVIAFEVGRITAMALHEAELLDQVLREPPSQE